MATFQPFRVARSAAARASLVFPIPPSPLTKTERPVPRAASSMVFERSDNSSPRPTRGDSAASRVRIQPMYERPFIRARLVQHAVHHRCHPSAGDVSVRDLTGLFRLALLLRTSRQVQHLFLTQVFHGCG